MFLWVIQSRSFRVLQGKPYCALKFFWLAKSVFSIFHYCFCNLLFLVHTFRNLNPVSFLFLSYLLCPCRHSSLFSHEPPQSINRHWFLHHLFIVILDISFCLCKGVRYFILYRYHVSFFSFILPDALGVFYTIILPVAYIPPLHVSLTGTWVDIYLIGRGGSNNILLQ